MTINDGIAIIGIDCRYPGANSLDQYWDNILSLRQQFRRIPDKRLNLEDYYSSDKSKVDYTYSQKASVLSGYNFDRTKYKVSKSTFDRTDMTHWLALDVAAGALKDAGLENGAGLDKNRVGVVLGNSLTGEFTRSSVMRLRWPYVLKVLESTLKSLDYQKDDIFKILSSTEKVYKDPFPEPDADSLAGGLSNTIGGRICNYFDFHGGGFTIDGACSSSLLAFENGCNSILNGSLDVVLVGGVDLSIDPFEIIGFARNGALALNDMDVYGSKAEGFWPGEGCGIVVLMKESEAIKRNMNIYSVIRGWGISSDGNGGIARPKSDTQQLAFDRAYERAGYDITEVSMFEGHGTGTPLGDQVEITALVNSLRSFNKHDTPAILGSVKHLIGHTKAAAGVAGVIKAALALKNGIIPASRPNTVNKLLKENDDIIKLGYKPQLWEGKNPMRASISSMGFGGINVHLTMEEAQNSKRNKKISSKVTKLSDSLRDCEIFPMSANSKQNLLSKVQRYKTLARDISRAELIDLSATIAASFQDTGCWKASIVAQNPDTFLESLIILEEALLNDKTHLVDINKGVFFDCTGETKKIGFLFPGQGSPVYQNLGVFSSFSKDFTFCARTNHISDNGISDTSIAQPAIIQNSLLSVELLEKFGVEAQWAMGHSLGEIGALSWAGVMDSDTAIQVAKERGFAMSEFGEKNGAMLALKCDEKTLHQLIEDRQVAITGFNGVGNYVVGGDMGEVNEVQKKALEHSVHNVKLKVSHAFHTPMMKTAAEYFNAALKKWVFEAPEKEVVSTVIGEKLGSEVDIKELLFNQIEAPVRFTQSIENIKNDTSYLIEVGPGNTLNRSLQDYQEFDVVSLDFGGNSLRGFYNALSIAYLAGNNITFDELSSNRYYKEFDIENWCLDVLINACEQNEHKSSFIRDLINTNTTETKLEDGSVAIESQELSLVGVQNFLKKIISEKTEMPYESITLEDKLMSQLHINSLAITEIISLVVKTFNKSQMVFSEASVLANADGTIGELSTLIFKGEGGVAANVEKGKVSFESIHNWSHIFQRKSVLKKASNINIDYGKGKVIIEGVESQVKHLEQKLATDNITIGNIGIFVYTSSLANTVFIDFVKFLQKPEVKACRLIALVNISDGKISGDLRPILRTFQLENLNASTICLEFKNEISIDLLLSELKNASKYKEVIYDANAQRFESEIDFFYPEKAKITEAFGKDDVILATGGGKGITFESVFEIALTTGAKLVILGRSLPEKDAELQANLNRLVESKIPYHYYPTDVCCKKSVHEAILMAKLEFGPITGFIHGAGINNPKSLQFLTSEDFEKTFTVKVEGIKNVVNELNVSDLKLLMGYGSIIAESGMHGNADYAWANDQLALYIDQVGEKNPNCRCMTLEWSIWDEVGMGVSLNTLDTLKQKGVWSIPVRHGLEILKAIIADKEYKGGRLIISGRYGEMPTLNYTKKRLPLGRFISTIKHHIPKVEVVSEVSINLNDDVYLQNHIFQNQYVFPTVMILEGMAQVCNILAEDTDYWVFEDLKINKSIFITKNETNIVRFFATRISANTFHLAVQSDDSNFETNCFEAYVKLGKKPDFKLPENTYLETEKLEINVESKFYDDLLFHHGPFRRIQSFLEVNALGAIAHANTSLNDTWFGEYLPTTLLLGDPGLNDASIHCHQACRPHNNLLPTGVGQIAFNSKELEGPFFIRTTEIYDRETTARIDVYVVNAKGEVKQFWKSLDLTRVTGSKFKGVWEPNFLTTYIEYSLMKMADSTDVKVPQGFLKQIDTLRSVDISDISEEIFGYTVSLSKKSSMNGFDIGKSENLLSNEINILDISEPIVLEIALANQGLNSFNNVKTLEYANF